MGISELKFKNFFFGGGALPPDPGPAGGLTAPPRPPAGLDMPSACHKGLWPLI